MATVPSVLIVDEDPEARYRARQLVQEAGFEAAGEGGLGTEAVALATERKPDVVLCGLGDPIARALQTIEALVHNLPDTPIVAYAASGDLHVVRQAMLAGARDFVQWPCKPDELARSLGAALESEERRRLRDTGGATIGPRGSIVTVFGAKGGAGKTTVATNLGVALVRSGDRAAVLVDADDSFGDAAASLGLRAGRTVIDALREPEGEDGSGMKRYVSYHDSGLAVLAAPANPFEWHGVAGADLGDGLRRLARQFDLVLVDTASSLSEVSLAALEAASLVLWVTTPDYASAHDSVRALQALENVPDDRIRVVLNRTSSEMDVSPASLEEALGRQIFWTVPYDRQLRYCAQLGRAVLDAAPESAAAASFVDLARVLNGEAPEARKNGVLSRLFGRTEQRYVTAERWQEAQP